MDYLNSLHKTFLIGDSRLSGHLRRVRLDDLIYEGREFLENQGRCSTVSRYIARRGLGAMKPGGGGQQLYMDNLASGETPLNSGRDDEPQLKLCC